MRTKKPKKPKKSALVKKLDTVFSLYIRNLYAIDGVVECYTCGSVKPVSEMQCGHFMSRRFYSTRWHVDNSRPQCLKCNIFHQGMQFEFGTKLQQEIGHYRVNEIRELRHQLTNYTVANYEGMIDYYANSLAALNK